MTAVTVRGRRSLIGELAGALPGVRSLAARILPLIREHAVSVAAFAAVDYGAFGLSRYAGWIVTGVSVLLLDFTVRG